MKIDDIKQIEIEAEFQKAVSYYMIVTGTSPVSRLYVKNTTEEDIEDVRVEIISEPAFTVPFCVETTLPRLSTIKFEPENLLSPLFTVALNARTQGRIVVRVSSGKRVLGETEAEVAVLAYGECDFSSHPIRSRRSFRLRPRCVRFRLKQTKNLPNGTVVAPDFTTAQAKTTFATISPRCTPCSASSR